MCMSSFVFSLVQAWGWACMQRWRRGFCQGPWSPTCSCLSRTGSCLLAHSPRCLNCGVSRGLLLCSLLSPPPRAENVCGGDQCSAALAPSAVLASQMCTGSGPSSSAPKAAPCKWESSKGWQKFLGPCTQVGNPDEAPCSWLQTHPARSCSLFLSLFLSVSEKIWGKMGFRYSYFDFKHFRKSWT